MRTYALIATMLYFLIGLTGCATAPKTAIPHNEKPLMIQRYFNGSVKAEGIVLNRYGEVTRSFTIDMHGKWSSPQNGTLAERIRYNNGEVQVRTWHFKFSDPHTFTATASDAVGPAHGTQYENTVHMVYTLLVPVDQTTYAINFDDKLYLTKNGKLFNRAELSKFGFNVGEIIITYDKK